ncbi:MAG: mechanosensitive ion channel family protein [Desulfohalobiaceae bacterium]|nr:mechanosensitive ion channel family protein [Desulfohalobiaceae bacterium]
MNLPWIDFQGILQMMVTWFLTNGLHILITVILMLIALKIAKMIGKRLLALFQKNRDDEFKKRAETLSSIIQIILSITILVIGTIIVLSELGIEIGPILATAGIFGLAIGFGAQNLVQDVISGFFLLLEDQVRVGDVIQVADKGGLVEKVGLRMIILRDLSGNVHFIRNGKVDVVTNMTKDYSRYVFEIGVAYRENVDEVIGVIKEVDEELRTDPEFKDDILEPIEILGLDKFADSAVIIKARNKTKPIKQWGVGREFNKRLKKAFDARDIEIPFPHMTLYAGQDKEGQASPLRLKMQDETFRESEIKNQT